MKTPLLMLSLAAGTFLGPSPDSSLAAPPAGSAAPTKAPESTDLPSRCTPGVSKEDALRILGLPGQVLPPAVWVYWNHPTRDPKLLQAGCDTLLVQFEENRVVAMRWVNGGSLRALLASHRAPVNQPGILVRD